MGVILSRNIYEFSEWVSEWVSDQGLKSHIDIVSVLSGLVYQAQWLGHRTWSCLKVLVCTYWSRLVLVRPQPVFIVLAHWNTTPLGRQRCPNPDHSIDFSFSGKAYMKPVCVVNKCTYRNNIKSIVGQIRSSWNTRLPSTDATHTQGVLREDLPDKIGPETSLTSRISVGQKSHILV